jgi:glycosyltransferase involved in cell wall biosynthesis
MKISAVIPLYNKEAYVVRAVNSVLAQTHSDLELIVVDDGSTDNGPHLVSQVRDPRLILVRQENRGRSAARNAGIQRASARHVAFLDADDEWAPQHVSTLVQLITDYPDAGLYCTGYRFVESTGKVKYPHWEDHPTRGYVKRYFLSVARGDLIATASSVCIPTAVFRDVGMFPEQDHVGEDQDMWARVALRYPVAVDCRQTTTYYGYAENRSFVTRPHEKELPYLTRLQSFLDNTAIEGEVRKDIEGYIRQGLFTLVSVNVRTGRSDIARRMLADSRLQRADLRFWTWKMLANLPSSIAVATLQAVDTSRITLQSLRTERAGMAKGT